MAEFDTPINVYNPGGMVKTIVHYEDNNYWIVLIGNATFTHQISIAEEDLRNRNFANAQITETNEQTAYERFVDNLPKFNDITTLA